jgi:hypothetical protein
MTHLPCAITLYIQLKLSRIVNMMYVDVSTNQKPAYVKNTMRMQMNVPCLASIFLGRADLNTLPVVSLLNFHTLNTSYYYIHVYTDKVN